MPLPSLPTRPREKSDLEKPHRAKIKPLRLRPVSAANRTGDVVDQLTELILEGVLPSGEPLPSERELSQQMGVSRNALREATKILQSRGLVTIKHGARTMINENTSEPVQQAVKGVLFGRDDALLQLTEVRLTLEVGIAALAAEQATKEDIAILQNILREMSESVEDSKQYIKWDAAFHRALAEATHNPIFVLMLDSIANLLLQSRKLALAFETPQKSLPEHQRIYQAIAKRDKTKAAKAMRRHLELQKTAFEKQLVAPVKISSKKPSKKPAKKSA